MPAQAASPGKGRIRPVCCLNVRQACFDTTIKDPMQPPEVQDNRHPLISKMLEARRHAAAGRRPWLFRNSPHVYRTVTITQPYIKGCASRLASLNAGNFALDTHQRVSPDDGIRVNDSQPAMCTHISRTHLYAFYRFVQVKCPHLLKP